MLGLFSVVSGRRAFLTRLVMRRLDMVLSVPSTDDLKGQGEVGVLLPVFKVKSNVISRILMVTGGVLLIKGIVSPLGGGQGLVKPRKRVEAVCIAFIAASVLADEAVVSTTLVLAVKAALEGQAAVRRGELLSVARGRLV